MTHRTLFVDVTLARWHCWIIADGLRLPCDASLHRSNLAHGAFCYGHLPLDMQHRAAGRTSDWTRSSCTKSSGFHLQLLDRKEVAYMIVFKIDRREVAYMIVFKNSFPPQQMLSIEHSSHRSHYCKPRNLPILTKNCSGIQHHHIHDTAMLFCPCFGSQRTLQNKTLCSTSCTICRLMYWNPAYTSSSMCHLPAANTSDKCWQPHERV